MQEILRTNNPVLFSYVRSLLTDAGIVPVEFDSHIAALEGRVSAIACRLMLAEEGAERARSALVESALQW